MSCRKFASHSSASDSAEEEGGKAEQKSQTVQPFGEIRFCEGATPQLQLPPPRSTLLRVRLRTSHTRLGDFC